MISTRTIRNLKNELSRSFLAKLGLILVGGAIFVAVLAPLLAPHDPTQQMLQVRNQPPVFLGGTWEYPLGTDALGRDMLSRVIYGARTSLLVGVVASGFGALVGIGIGIISGYYRGWIDDVAMRSVDVSLAIPGLVLALTIFSIIGPIAINIPDPIVALGFAQEMPDSFTFPGTVAFVIGVIAVRQFARLARGEALSVREEEYVKSSEAAGASNIRVMFIHVLPNTMTPLLVFWTLRLAHAILTESTLSFLGFSGTTLSWGYDISAGRDYLGTAWWIASVPGVAILFAVIGVNLLGDWLRDALDPGLQEGYE
ncbi:MULTISPECIES: ABC transporter permease [Haloferacaceae]|uniref:ABC transporter permease n=1 Tax=Halorubrum glutamatedens TaxID=2707018 RepID=A0ABD5QN86_9EURY|nr:ABC transporter permease [Halobellus captivus]